MNKILIILLAFFFISSCAEFFTEQKLIKQKREKDRLLKQQVNDRSTCKYYGFKENTDSFADCMMNLGIARNQAILTRKMLECEAVRRDNNESKATGFWGGVLKGARENLACD